MKDDDRTTLERNLEALVRHAALPVRDEDLPRARRAFLRLLVEPQAEHRPRAATVGALAASLLVCAAIFSAILSERRAVPDATPPVPPLRAAAPQETRVAPAPPAAQDRVVAVTCTLPSPKARSPVLRIEGKAELPDRLILKLGVLRFAEQGLGKRLAAAPERAASGLVEVRSGRFVYSCPWEIAGPAAVTVEVIDDFQRNELREKFGGRAWRFEFPGWTPEFAGQLSPALLEVDAFLPEIKDLIAKVEAAVVTEASWRAVEKALLEKAHRLQRRIEGCEARKVYPASVNLLFYTMNSLLSSAAHFAWEEGKYVGPKTYYSGGEIMKTFRNEDFGFDRLRAYVDEAGPLAGREMALWIVREIRRGGPRPALAPIVLEQTAHAGLAPFAARLQAAAPEDLDGLEAEIRAGAR